MNRIILALCLLLAILLSCVSTGAFAQSFPPYVNSRAVATSTQSGDVIPLVRGARTFKIDPSLLGGGGNPCTATVGGSVPTPPNDPTRFLNGQCAWALPPGGLTVGTSTITGGVNGKLLYDNGGLLGEAAVGSGLSFAGGVLSATGGGGSPGGSAGDFQINGGGGVFGSFTPGAGIQAFLTTPTSANLRAALTDETGTGAAYFAGGNAGTPSAIVLTNGTGLPTGGLLNAAVTYGKMQSGAITGLLGVNNGGAPSEIALGSGLSLSGSTLSATGGGSWGIVGTSVLTSGSTTRVLYDNAGVLGEYTVSGSGNVCMTTNCALTTPNLGTPSALTLTNATGLPTSGLNAAAVTYPKIQNGSLTGLLGVNNGAAPTEVTIGSGLSLSGGTLSVPSGGATGAGVDGGTSAQTVTGTTTIANATRLVKVGAVGTPWVTGILTLPAIAAVGSDEDICIVDGGGFVSGSATVTIAPNGADAINGGSVGVSAGPFSRMDLCLRISATHNWALESNNAYLPVAATPNITVVATAPSLAIGTTLPHHAPVDGGSHSYTILAADLTEEVDLVSTFTAAVVPQATGSFTAGVGFSLCNDGAITATSTTSTINGIAGATGIKLGAHGCSDWSSDGTNWRVEVSVPQPATQTGTTFLRDDMTWQTPAGGSSAAAKPQGRLTCSSGAPVMLVDVAACTTIYYDTSEEGNLYPNWSGSAMVNVTITGDEISMGLDAGVPHVASGSNYDIFGTAAAAICVGPAWTSDTARGTGAGTTELQLKNGVWTNKNALTNCWGGAAGVTNLGSIAANQGTYLGSLRGTASGTTKMVFTPAPASGGTASVLGLYNAYNRVGTMSRSMDTAVAYSYTTATWRASNNSASNRVSWIDGLARSPISTTFQTPITAPSAVPGYIGINFNSTTASPLTFSGQDQNVAGNTDGVITNTNNSPPLIGFNYAQAMEYGGTNTAFGNNKEMVLLVRLDM